MKLCATSSLHAVNRPRDLWQPSEVEYLPNVNPWVIGGKTAVVTRMQILRCSDGFKVRHQPIRDLDDLVALTHFERPTCAKVVL